MIYLILHKVRNAPAFDIAERHDDMGTPSDPGPWWIIPTSGHRAYPLTSYNLEDLADVSDYPHKVPFDYLAYDMVNDNNAFADLPDHYTINHSPTKRITSGIADLLKSLTGPKLEPKKRRMF